MHINDMSRKDFENLPYLEDMEAVEIDCVVFIPSRRHDDSGFNIFEVVGCRYGKALGKIHGYDTFSIYMESDFNRVGFDCLRGSGLMRVFLPPNEYIIYPMFHEVRKKKEEIQDE